MTWEAYFSPCYLNVIDPVNVAFGEGVMLNVTHELYEARERTLHDTGILLSKKTLSHSFFSALRCLSDLAGWTLLLIASLLRPRSPPTLLIYFTEGEGGVTHRTYERAKSKWLSR